MRPVAFAVSLILGLPQVGTAAALGVRAEPVLLDSSPLERALAPAGPAQGLDLRIDGVQPRILPDAPDGAGAIEAERAERSVATDPRSERGLSFDLEIKPRSGFGALAREDETEDPSLGDRLDKLIERPVFGLRGRYRF